MAKHHEKGAKEQHRRRGAEQPKKPDSSRRDSQEGPPRISWTVGLRGLQLEEAESLGESRLEGFRLDTVPLDRRKRVRCAFQLHDAAATVIRDGACMNCRLTNETVGTINRRFGRMGLWASDNKSLVIECLVSNNMGL